MACLYFLQRKRGEDFYWHLIGLFCYKGLPRGLGFWVHGLGSRVWGLLLLAIMKRIAIAATARAVFVTIPNNDSFTCYCYATGGVGSRV